MNETGAIPRGDPAELADLLERFPGRLFDPGDVLIENTYRQPCKIRRAALAYVAEGLVRGAWHRSVIAPANRATAVIAGDGRWIGFDAFKFGENLFRYVALTPTTASIVPLEYLREEASHGVLVHALQSVSLDWCTSASVMSLGRDTLERRTLLLLYDMRRLHPRPEIEVRQRDVADLLGVVRQTLHPVLKRLEEKGLIGLGYGEITIGEAADLFGELGGEPLHDGAGGAGGVGGASNRVRTPVVDPAVRDAAHPRRATKFA